MLNMETIREIIRIGRVGFSADAQKFLSDIAGQGELYRRLSREDNIEYGTAADLLEEAGRLMGKVATLIDEANAVGQSLS